MKKSLSLALVAVLACVSMMTSVAEAKDIFFIPGYDVLHVVDGEKDELIKEIPADGWLRECVISDDKKYVYTTSGRRTLYKIDYEQGKIVASVDFDKDGWERHIYGFKIDKQGETGYFYMMPRKLEGGQARVAPPVIAQADLKTGKILRSVEVPYGVMKISLNEETGKVYAIGQDIYTVDISGKEMALVDTYSLFDKGYNLLPGWDMQYENGEVYLQNYYTAEGMGLISVDVQSGKITDTQLPPEAAAFAYGYVYNSDKTKAYGSMDEISVLDLKTKTLTAYEVIQTGTKFAVNLSSDDKKVYVGGGGSILAVYDAETMKLIKEIHLSSDGWDVRRMVL